MYGTSLAGQSLNRKGVGWCISVYDIITLKHLTFRHYTYIAFTEFIIVPESACIEHYTTSLAGQSLTSKW